MEAHELLAFGPFRLDTRARVLLKDGAPVSLPPKSYETLAYLARNRGRAVSREELARQVWPDVVVGDGSLSQAIFVLRKALGESEESARIVETVPRVGYRFGAEVEALDAAASPPAVRPRARPSRRTALAVVAILALAAGLFLWLWRRPATVPRRAAGLLTSTRELAAAPDATRLLGHVETSSILEAPGAYDLVPDDGSAATRVPLKEGETPIGVWDGALALASGETLELRHPLKHESTRSLGLPPLPKGEIVRSWAASPDGRFLARRLGAAVEILEGRGAAFAVVATLAYPHRDDERLAIGPHSLALAGGGGEPLRVFALPDGKLSFEAPLPEFGVTCLAVDESGTRVAAGGHFDEILVFNTGAGSAPVHVTRHAWTHGLAFVPDAPTLVASGYEGLAAVRDGGVAAELPRIAVAGEDVRVFADGLLVFSPQRHRLALVSYAGAPPSRRVDLKSSVVWALATDAAERTLYAGGRDGKLYALGLAGGRPRSTQAHGDGIPALLRDGDLLASSSDDKTVALWSLPAMKLVRRQAAHRYLVNDLALAPRAPSGPTLVTSSSDGELKTWSWPALEPRETIDPTPLVGRKSELHALWVSADLSRLLVGTWDGALLDITRTGRTSARRLETRASVVYKLAELPPLGLVAGVGHDPSLVFVFDLATREITEVDADGLDAFWCAAEPDGKSLVVVGTGGISRYTFTHEGKRVGWTLSARRQSGLPLTTATVLRDGTVWAGTADGTLVSWAPGALGASPNPPRVR